MRYSASEKAEIIKIVEASHLPTKQTLAMLDIPRSTFYRWYDLWLEGGIDALGDQSPRPTSVWNKISDVRRQAFIEFALETEDLSARELAIKYTDEKRYFISESSAYRILREGDLLTAPAYVTLSAADEFHDKTTRPNELWQTDFTYFKSELLMRHWFKHNGERLGLVLSEHDFGRLQPLYCGVEVMFNDESPRPHGYA